MSLRVTLLLTLACCCGASIHAQDVAPAPLVKASEPDSLADDLKEYGALFKRGFNDALIFKINRKIAETGGKPDPRLLYFRGLTYYRLGWNPEAKVDLVAARSERVYSLPDGFGAKWTLDEMERLTALMPPKFEEIRQGERVLFRMHYFSMEGGTATVFGLLPAAYRVNREMFGSDIGATTVLVFETQKQFRDYHKELSGGKELGSWISACVSGNRVLVCLERPDSSSYSLDHRSKFVGTIVHEFNHLMLGRLMGYAARPGWFEEGLAQIPESQFNENLAPDNQRILKRLFVNNALVSIENLSTGSSFTEQTELGLVMNKGGDSQSAPSPYVQGYGMTQYLLNNISTPQLQSFLNRARESNDFTGSFQDEFGFSLEQFYDLWKRDYAQKLATQ